LTSRRAFRYAKSDATLTIAASPVEPDVRVTSRQTLSLGEDRGLLAAGLEVVITRAGIAGTVVEIGLFNTEIKTNIQEVGPCACSGEWLEICWWSECLDGVPKMSTQ